jgi:hypothetical protein
MDFRSPGSELYRVRVGASGFPINRMLQMVRWRMHQNGDRQRAPIALGVNIMLPMERSDNSKMPGLGAVARALRRLLFLICLLLGLAFAVICYAEMFGVVQFD